LPSFQRCWFSLLGLFGGFFALVGADGLHVAFAALHGRRFVGFLGGHVYDGKDAGLILLLGAFFGFGFLFSAVAVVSGHWVSCG